MTEDDTPIDWAALARAEGLYDESGRPKIAYQRPVGANIKKAPKRRERPKKPHGGARVHPKEEVKVSDDGKLCLARVTTIRSGIPETTLTIYRQIPSHPRYFVSQSGDVRGADGRRLRNGERASKLQVRLRVGASDVRLYRSQLVWEAWPEVSPTVVEDGVIVRGEKLTVIPDFPDYVISQSSRKVLHRWKLEEKAVNQGRVYLSKDKKQIGIAVNRLMREVFGEAGGDDEAVLE